MPQPFAARLTRVVVLWLLALVLPLQSAAVGVFTAIGPAHVHRAAEAPLVLTDFRRWRPTPVAKAHVFTAVGHFHAGTASQRHYHNVDDGSVVRTEAKAPDADEALSAAAVSVLALIPAVAMWAAPRATASIDTGPLWALRTGFTGPLDRPPRPSYSGS